MEAEPIFCDRCTRVLTPGAGDWYVVWIHAVADPSGPVVERSRSPEEIRREIERLVADMSKLSPQEALDQVQRRLSLFLCRACFTDWIENPLGD